MNDNLRPHILMLYKKKLEPSIRLCGHSQLEKLSKEGIVEYRHSNFSNLTSESLLWADTVILGRLDMTDDYMLVKKLKKTKKQLLYLLDDDLLDVPAYCNSSFHYGNANIKKNIKKIISMCDGILSPSPLILKKYLQQGQFGIIVEEPAIAPIQYTKHNSNFVKIGFAGSVDRTDDLETLLGNVLTRVHERYKEKVKFEFFGAIPSFAANLGATTLPYQGSYETYRDTMNESAWDIGLAPMPETDFHACKHYNKYCEYAAAGIVGVFSEVMPYTRIQEKYDGAVLCPNAPEAWYQTLCRLIDDEAYRENLRKTVSSEANGNLSEDAVARDFFEAMGTKLHYKQPDLDIRSKVMLNLHGLKVCKLSLKLISLMLFCCAFGIKAPVVVPRKLLSKIRS